MSDFPDCCGVGRAWTRTAGFLARPHVSAVVFAGALASALSYFALLAFFGSGAAPAAGLLLRLALVSAVAPILPCYVLLLLTGPREDRPRSRRIWNDLAATHAPLLVSCGFILFAVLPSTNLRYVTTLVPFTVLGLWLACLGLCFRLHFPRRFHHFLLAVIMLAGFVLRMNGLGNQSLWNDELLTVTLCDPDNSVEAMLSQNDELNHIPPLYFFAMWVWFQVTGVTDISARLFSALIGVLSIGAIYGLGRKLCRPGVGLFAALLASFNWSHLLHSQDARPYSLLILTAALSYWAFLVFLELPTLRRAALVTAAGLLLVYTHYFGWLILMAQAIQIAASLPEYRGEARRRLAVLFPASLAMIVVCYLPYVPRTIASFATEKYWAPKPESNYFIDLTLFLFHDPLLSIMMAALMIAAFLRPAPYRPGEGRAHALFTLGLWLAVCTFVPLAHSLHANVSVFVPRYLLILLPAFLVLAAMGIEAVRYIPARVLLTAVIIGCGALDLFSWSDYYHRPAMQEYRELVARLPLDASALCFAKHKQTFKFGYYLKKAGSPAAVHDADAPTLQSVLGPRAADAQCEIWVLENIEFYGVVKDPVFLAFADRFLVQQEELTAFQVRARRYAPNPGRRDEMRALLERDPATWDAVLTPVR